jgi:hypothetical protein
LLGALDGVQSAPQFVETKIVPPSTTAASVVPLLEHATERHAFVGRAAFVQMAPELDER